MYCPIDSLPLRIRGAAGSLPGLAAKLLLAAALFQLPAAVQAQGLLSVTCRPDKSVACTVTPSFDVPTATSGCGLVTVTELVTSDPNFICGKTYSLTRTWLVADDCQSVFCSQTITVKAKGPDIDSAPDKTVAWGTGWDFDKPKLNISFCGNDDVDVDVIYTITNALCGRSYQVTRKWEARDGCGNKDSCKQIVTVLDSSGGPVLEPKADKTVECGDAWTFDAPTAFDSSDGSPLMVTVISTVTNVVARSFMATCTWETADACGHTARCAQSVTMQDSAPPLLAGITDKTVELGVPWTFGAPTAVDRCFGSAVQVYVVATVTNLARGLAFSATRSWGASDPFGNNSAVNQTVTVVDTTPPTLVVPGDLQAHAGAAWAFGTPTASDAGGAVTLVVESTLTNRSCGGSFVAVRTWRATDPSGNSAVGSQTVTVTDDGAPTLTCAGARTVEAGVAWNFDAPVAFDLGEGGAVPVLILGTSTNVLSGGRLSVTRTWRATDGCGNKAECGQTVTVVDTTPPTIVVPADLRVRAGTAWNFGTPTTSDAGGAVTLAVESTITNRSCGASLVARRTWRATDSSGNTAVGSQTATVTDDEAPTMTCAPGKVVEAGHAWNFDAPSAFDIGEGASIPTGIISTSTNGLPDGRIEVARVWRAVDACGNAAQCSQTVSIVDTAPPTLVVPVDFQARAGTPWEFGMATATDAGGPVTVDVVETTTHLICGSSIVARRSWRATDRSGNSALGAQTVTVLDDQQPTLTCDAAKTVEAGNDWNFDEPVAFKTVEGVNIPVPVAIASTTTNNGSSSGATIVTRVWRAADACGNVAECRQVVTLIDTTPPVFVSVPPGALYHCFGDVPLAPVIEAMDAGDGPLIANCTTTTNGVCPTYITHTWTATDLHGNQASATQTHRVSVKPPRIVGQPSDRTACAGERVELCLELADVCEASYEWFKDGQPLAGQTGPCLAFDAVTVSDAGAYCVRVNGNFCPDGEPQLMRCATLVVHPVLFVDPLDNVSVRVGETTTFRVNMTGPASGASVVWRRNGVVIPESNGNSLTIASARVADAGLYTVEVQAFCGSVTQSAILAVMDLTVPNTAPVISSIADRVLEHNESTGRIPFTIGDAESAPEALLMSVVSSEPMLLPTGNILLAGTGANRTVMVVAPSAGRGQATVTLLLSDGVEVARTSFKVTIVAPEAPRGRLAICVHGLGIVTPDLNGQELVLGERYTVRAVHGPGQMFTGWTGEAAGAEPALTFVMTPNLTLNVGFSPNPYLTMAGNYNGLFHEADEVRQDTSGFLTLTRNAKGRFSATLLTGGTRVRFSGQFDALGSATNLIRRVKALPYMAELHIGAGDRPDEISGRIARGTWAAGVLADRAAFHAVTNKAPYAGRYTLLIPGQTPGGTAPAGDGYATLTVSVSGRVTFVGALADGRRVVQRVAIGRLGDWPLYAALYAGHGSLLSWQTFGNRPTEDVGGLLSWIRPALPGSASFATGFSLNTAVTGSRFVKPLAGHRVLELSDGVVTFSHGPSDGFANRVTLGADNKVTNHGENALQLLVNRANGLFYGTVVNPLTGAKETFRGALLQKQNRGAGFCPGASDVGRVTFDADSGVR